MTYYAQHGFATNEVVGAVAAALLHDLHVNNFVFAGFPAVSVMQKDESFEIRLALDGMESEALVIPFKTGKEFARTFQKKQQIGSEWMRKIQDLVVQIERQSSERNDARRRVAAGDV
ncbi:hypothetical protein [Ramlibacter humi]|uniref:Uncharacterized protein n=1 Tax=Ramlibacter humi TaxID=2530451 RepID=A0A4Z0BB58_9BURK|nr:hypothetical protein [Ramlibacter humi]TFY96326.1 hypothetical protein EZ216_20510 [Ramlibacter humi]